MKFVPASSLDAHDRKRFNELLSSVDPDVVVEKEFDTYIEKISTSRWLARARLVEGPLPRLDVGYRARVKTRRAR